MSTMAATMSRASPSASGTPAPSRWAESAATTSPTRAGAAVPNAGKGMTSAIQPLFRIRFAERLDQRPDLAIERSRQLVDGESNAVIGHAVLGKVIRANFGRPVARSDLRLAHAGTLGLLFRHLEVEQARTQYLHCACTVLNLGPLILLTHDDAGRDVGDSHGTISGVHALSAGAGGAE